MRQKPLQLVIKKRDIDRAYVNPHLLLKIAVKGMNFTFGENSLLHSKFVFVIIKS